MNTQNGSEKHILTPFLTMNRPELCIRCPNEQVLDRVLIADYNPQGNPNTIEKITEYKCTECGYVGPHDYPLLVRRQGLKPDYLFIVSKSYDDRVRGIDLKPFLRLREFITSWTGGHLKLGAVQFQETAKLIRSTIRESTELSLFDLPEKIRAAPFTRGHLPFCLPKMMPGFLEFEARVREASTFSLLMKAAGLKPPHLWQGIVGEDIKAKFRGIEKRQAVIDATLELKKLVDRRDPEAVATLATAILSQSYEKPYPDDLSEQLLPFALNLAWALAGSYKATLVVAPDDAIKTIESAVGYLRTRNEPERLADALRNLGSVYMHCRRGNLEEHVSAAMRAYEQATEIYIGLGGEKIVKAGNVLLDVSDVFRKRMGGDPSVKVEMALSYVELALQLFRQHGDERDVARALSYRGRTHLNRGAGLESHNWYRALEDISAAFEIWNRLYANDRSLENSVIEESINLGAAKTEVGNLTNDVVLIESAVGVLKPTCEKLWARNSGEIYDVSVELLIAYDYLLRADPNRSDIFEEALWLVDKLEAWIRQQPEQYPQQNVYPLATTAGLRGSIFVMRANHDVKILDRAAAAIEEATAGFKKIGFGYGSYTPRMELANAFHRAGEVEMAEKLYLSAASDAREYAQEAISLSSLANLSKSAYVADQFLGFLQAERGRLYEALCTLESGLAITLRRGAFLARSQNALDPATKERLAALTQEHQMLSAAVEARSKEFWSDPETTVARIKELDTAIRESVGAVEPIDLSIDKTVLSHSIPENGALIVPFISPSGGLWICVDNVGAEKPRFSKVATPELSGKLGKLVVKLPVWEPIADALLSESRLVAKNAASELTGAMEWLGNAVGRPLCHHLSSLGIERGAQIAVLGHGFLTLIPFHAATWRDESHTEVLGLIYNLIMVPSLTWLTQTLTRKASEIEERNGVLVVADSSADLQGSRMEGQSIVSKMRDRNCVLLTGSEATKAALIEALPSALHLHIAGHSQFNLEMPFLSSVTLADENLTVADLVAQVEKAPPTVVLSSCSSGMGAGLQETSESWGFPFALHSWGVKTVISNLWPTLDIAMLLFFSEYYRTDKVMLSPVTAFRAAQTYLHGVTAEDARVRLQEICNCEPESLAAFEPELNFIINRYGDSAPFSHPAFWAAISCSGVPEMSPH